MTDQAQAGHPEPFPAGAGHEATMTAWRDWAEQSFGADGRQARAAFDAAADAISRGASADEAAAAGHAAAEQVAAADSLDAWRDWAEQSFGGDPDRVRAAVSGAMRAIAVGASRDEIAAAATAAATAHASAGGGSRHGGGGQYEAGEPGRKGWVRGRVHGYQARFESQGRRQASIWNFRVDPGGGAGPSGESSAVAVQMRGFHFDGAINEGDLVEIKGAAGSGKLQKVRKVRNLTSNSVVRAHGHPLGGFGRFVVTTLGVLFFLAIVGIIVITVLVARNTGGFSG